MARCAWHPRWTACRNVAPLTPVQGDAHIPSFCEAKVPVDAAAPNGPTRYCNNKYCRLEDGHYFCYEHDPLRRRNPKRGAVAAAAEK